MPILTGSTHQFTFPKKSNTIYSNTATATASATHQPPTGGSFLKVTVSGGTNNTGTVTTAGSLGGVAKTDTLTYTGEHWYITANQYDTISANGITTNGLANESTKPTVLIESTDQSGTPKTWTTNYIYYGIFKQSESGHSMLKILAEGLSAPIMYNCRIDTDADIDMGDLFTVVGQNGTYAVWSEPQRHFQLGTDLVDYVQFFATLKSK